VLKIVVVDLEVDVDLLVKFVVSYTLAVKKVVVLFVSVVLLVEASVFVSNIVVLFVS